MAVLRFAAGVGLGLCGLGWAGSAGAASWDSSLVSIFKRGSDSPNGSGVFEPRISADGRYVAFTSNATQILPVQYDTNDAFDVFLHDRTTDATRLVSRALSGDGLATANGASRLHGLSDDGRYVLFCSTATDLVADITDANGIEDCFVFDAQSDTSTLVTHAAGSPNVTANGEVFRAILSRDGTKVLYDTEATDAVPGLVDTNGRRDLVFLDRATGEVTAPFRAANGGLPNQHSLPVAMSPDGRWLLCVTQATGIVTGFSDTNNFDDVFLVDRTTGTTMLVSRAAGAASTGNGFSVAVGLSDDGRYVAFYTSASNVAADATDSNGTWDTFLFDRDTGTSTLVSRAFGGGTTGSHYTTATAMSTDGRYVLMDSFASDLVAGLTDANAEADVYVHDRVQGTIRLVSSAAGTTTTTANGASRPWGLSRDGRYAVFTSTATNVVAGVVDTNNVYDAFVVDLSTGAPALASRAHTGAAQAANGNTSDAGISADGAHVLFLGASSNHVANVLDVGGNDAFVHSRATGSVSWASRARGRDTANAASRPASISDSGRYLYYYTDSSDHCAGITAVTARDVFLQDRTTGVCTLVSRLAGATLGGATGTPSGLSADGRYALFYSNSSNIVAGTTDQSNTFDYFLFDRDTLTNQLVTRRSGTTIALGGASFAISAQLSGNGRWVSFATTSSLVMGANTDTNGQTDAFLFDASSGTQAMVSRAVGTGVAANGASAPRAVSSDGRYVLFSSSATNLVSGFTDRNASDIDTYSYDRLISTSVLVSRQNGTTTAGGNGRTEPIAMSDDGEWNLVVSNASDLAAVNDVQSFPDGYLCQRSAGTCRLVTRSTASATQTSDRGGTPVGMSRNGRWIVYASNSSDVVTGLVDLNGAIASSLYLYDRDTGATVLVDRRGNDPLTTPASGQALFRAVSDDGQRVLFAHTADDIVPGVVDTNATFDLFMLDRASGTTTLVSRAYDAVYGSGADAASDAVMTPNGATVFYGSTAPDVLEVDNNEAMDAFVAEPRFVVTPVANEGGSLSPGRAVTVIPGQGTSFAITTLPHYALQSISGCGGLRSGDTYFTAAVNADCTVTATFVATAHTLRYAAGASGSLQGEVSQVVAIGGDGTAVTAVPDAGYRFVQWSDGSTANPRVDSDVTANVDVTATFANSAPTLALAGSFAALEDGGVASLVFTVSDVESAPGSLVATASVQPAGMLENVSIGAGASANERVLSFTPVANASGAATVTVTVRDPPNASNAAALVVTITGVNDAPAVTLGTVATHPAASTGARSVPGFATFVAGPGPEAATQAVLDYELVSLADPDAILANGSLDIANDGTLVYTLTGRGGTANASVRVRDDGGTSNGGVDVSSTAAFSLSVVRSADVRVTKDNGGTTLAAGATTVYAIDVENLGPNAVSGALLADALPAGLVDGVWTCVASASTAPCPAPTSGTGNLAIAIALGAGQRLRYDVMAEVDAPDGAFVENTAVVVLPGTLTTLNPSDDSATDRDEVFAELVFRNGFE